MPLVKEATTALVLSMVLPSAMSGGHEGAAAGDWFYVLLDLGPFDSVTVNVSGSYSCPGQTECSASIVMYSELDPRGSRVYAGSSTGAVVQLQLGGDAFHVPLYPGVDPLPIGVDYIATFTESSDGRWAVLALLATGSGASDVEIEPAAALRSQGGGTAPVTHLRASAFAATLDASIGGGLFGPAAGMGYTWTERPTKGLLGWFAPVGTGVAGPSGFEGPGVGGECMEPTARVVVGGMEPLPEYCRTWSLHAHGGPWSFYSRARALTDDVPWGMWVDAFPPESAFFP